MLGGMASFGIIAAITGVLISLYNSSSSSSSSSSLPLLKKSFKSSAYTQRKKKKKALAKSTVDLSKLLVDIENLPPPSNEKLDYHCVWFGNLLNHHILSIASLFETQKNPRVYLWTNQESYPKLKKLESIFKNYNFEIKIGNFQELPSYQSLAFKSDYWRIQILNLMGGFYFDLDVLFLKDMSWVINYGHPIVQEGYMSENTFNNAILYYPAGHFGLAHWLNRLKTFTHLSWDSVFNSYNYSNLDKFGAKLLPNKVCDNGWIDNPLISLSWDDFFEKQDVDVSILIDKLSTSFCYHWHNRYNKTVEKENTTVNYFWKKFVLSNDKITIE